MRPIAFPRFIVFLLACGISGTALRAEQVSCAVQQPPSDAATTSFNDRDYAKALDLYAAAAKSNPKDVQAVAGEVRSLLGEERVDDAAALVKKSVAEHPKNAVLETVLGEVRFRQGRLDDAVGTYRISLSLDPCLARVRYDFYKLLWIESMHAEAYSQLQVAHLLEPDGPDIHLAWIELLPLKERSHAIDGYLATAHEDSLDKRQDLREYAERLRAILAGRKSSCHLAGPKAASTTLPFKMLLSDAYHISGLGFDVKVNDKAKATLELDTGASGLLLNRNTARKAGLVPVTTDKISGIGDQKSMSGYWAFADDLQIGTLEFKDCLVEVADKRSIVDVDGLIGADVFENYQVDLDFPLLKMTLSPLPLHAGESPVEKGALNAAGIGTAAASSVPVVNASTAPVSEPAIHYTDRYISPEMKSWSPFARVGHQILINGHLKDKEPRLFLLDSGANITILSVPAAKSVGKVHLDNDAEISGLNGHVKKVYSADNVDLVFAKLRAPLKDVPVMDLGAISNSNGTEVSGMIGLNALMMLTVDIDYRDGLIDLAYDPNHGRNVRIH